MVLFIADTFIPSFCTFPLVLLDLISGWKKPPLLSALCQPDKAKPTGCHFPSILKQTLGKGRSSHPAWNQAEVFLTLAASPSFPPAHISSTSSFFPTGFLQALFYFTQNQLSNTNVSHPCEHPHSFLQTILEAQLNFCSPALPVLFWIRGITAFH